jgi:enterochelin esterase family protein
MAAATSLNDVLLSYRAPSMNVRAVRLHSDVFKRTGPPAFTRRGRSRTWELRLRVPEGINRLEYQLEVVHADGSTEIVNDPGNPLRASAPFGDRSVLELDGYEPPVWLDDEEAPTGTLEPFSFRSRLLRTNVRGFLWTAHGVEGDTPLPMLYVHDGPEYAEYSHLLRLFDSAIAELEVRPFRAALLEPPGNRNETYSAATRYANALANEIVPGLDERAPTIDLRGARVAMGASLGALAAVHAHRLHPRLFGALFLQSGSFFTRTTDRQESTFARFARVTRFVGSVLRDERWRDPVPAVLTCGKTEENLANNRALRDALARQRYDVRLHEHPDLHNWVSWRDTFHPHLVGLLERLWG